MLPGALGQSFWSETLTRLLLVQLQLRSGTYRQDHWLFELASVKAHIEMVFKVEAAIIRDLIY